MLPPCPLQGVPVPDSNHHDIARLWPGWTSCAVFIQHRQSWISVNPNTHSNKMAMLKLFIRQLDVRKTPGQIDMITMPFLLIFLVSLSDIRRGETVNVTHTDAVSYTHLTLPTN
eukprot:3712433-Ditylum_brightwellii.AAC.1